MGEGSTAQLNEPGFNFENANENIPCKAPTSKNCFLPLANRRKVFISLVISGDRQQKNSNPKRDSSTILNSIPSLKRNEFEPKFNCSCLALRISICWLFI